ncbi:hypothetical protein IKE71_03095 [Candidatus Saccharibacteria bacterium]|nr:hypothetical protein [Candidatus Saccharibacteria bacterium]
MSKKLIAGAGIVASLAVALAPLATFAADAAYNSDVHTDTLNVNVLPTCAFGAANATPVVTGVAHNNASNTPLVNGTNSATWSVVTANDNLGMTPDAAEQTEHPSADSAAYSIYAGTADDNMGTTTLKVVCNQPNGYKIKVTAGELAQGTDKISPIASPSASTTGYKITTAGTADTVAPVISTTATEAVIKNSASAATGDEFTFTYSIGVAAGTKAGTYTGDVVYTLVQQLGA